MNICKVYVQCRRVECTTSKARELPQRARCQVLVLNQFISGTLIGAGSKTILCGLEMKMCAVRQHQHKSTVVNFSA